MPGTDSGVTESDGRPRSSGEGPDQATQTQEPVSRHLNSEKE